jgi:hypothetical protein
VSKLHWEQVYGSKAPDAVSWYAPHLDESLSYIRRASAATDASIIDVGGWQASGWLNRPRFELTPGAVNHGRHPDLE